MKFTVLIFMFVLFITDTTNHDLTIEITNLKEEYVGKNLYIGYWGDDKENFPNEHKVVIKDKLTVNSTGFEITKDLVENTYAVSLYIDMNGNGELDKNMFGIPKEPYCFSRNYRPKLSAPDFDDCSFLVSKDTKITLELID
ncbi:DUF2141 domain-containing protein [Aurantibacter crassamenti]|uniref:DUF2141 domain-containing protein n=1 Tax=Aurantibacter crassamenti TaxID=1837375 RepID=UPI00193A0A04|nr:DUF2141 domain-containing protein [Aurantibacter crassamenti]MBM1107164.1 DUF2141 domain-containing protein [Aurantibacter crassamenti]